MGLLSFFSDQFSEGRIETWGDEEAAREAMYVCKVLGNARTYNSPADRALREVWHGREAQYIYGRFAGTFGWTLADCERFYRRNR